MEYQDVEDILNCQPDELTTDFRDFDRHRLTTEELHGKQKEEKKQMMRKTRKFICTVRFHITRDFPGACCVP
ncbi:hypothetical protein M514_00836 [Trichuris suis]|uniref:Uncharacterized protein n=1 Tax=Trichuris suis TaxID=68888 RepID=A0A085N071_9BILA|nr:hypothetical protein M513_00836 [Trichuris suis]KFD62867.1 hypothetical protein M514_00836 [Trichuris suis]